MLYPATTAFCGHARDGGASARVDSKRVKCGGLSDRAAFGGVCSHESVRHQFQRGFPVFAWLTAEKVAVDGLANCAKGRAISVPGGLYKGLVRGSALLPRAVKRLVCATAMKRIYRSTFSRPTFSTRHQRARVPFATKAHPTLPFAVQRQRLTVREKNIRWKRHINECCSMWPFGQARNFTVSILH
jgi:hypothetical protein